MTRYWAEHAWLGGDRAEAGVLIDVEGERIAAVGPDSRPDGAIVLRGLTLPGFANAHSHAFHRALRGRTHRGGGTFWTWREDMYAVAERLDPDAYRALARAVFAEMALAGITCVGEFHYLHHGDGALRGAQRDGRGADRARRPRPASGSRCSTRATSRAGSAVPPEGVQQRFSDGDAHAWAERASALQAAPHARIGAAIHSVRAVPADQLATVAAWARERGAPLHVHLSEQRAENEACLAAHGRTPAELLDEHGALGARLLHGPRDAPHRRGHRPPRRHRDLHVRDHRARPRRRHRARRARSPTPARRCASAATATP